MSPAAPVQDDTTNPPPTKAEEVSHIRRCHPSTQAAGATHLGRARSNNEDRFALFEDMGLYLVADGLGGHSAGEVAAQIATYEIPEYLQNAAPETTRHDATRRDATPADPDSEDPLPRLHLGLLSLAVQQANKAIHLAARNKPEYDRMGTTVAALLLTPSAALLAHVGDSRIYLLRNGHLRRLTQDHSAAEEYLQRHGIHADPESVRARAHILTRCLGTYADVRVSMAFEPLHPGDVFLLCTDGLWGVVPHDLIAQTLAHTASPQEAAQQLIDFANQHGGPDNITAVVVKERSGASTGLGGGARLRARGGQPY